MDWITITVFSLFMLLSAGFVLITLLGLPGGWLMLLLAVVIESSSSYWGSESIWGWPIIGICFGLIILGEVIELIASGIGSKLGGGSTRGMWGAILGSIAGALAGTFMIPIPLIGTLIGAVAGAFIGTVLAELTHKDSPTLGQIVKSGIGATLGRILGIFGKTGIAAIIWCLLLAIPTFLAKFQP